MSAKHLIEPPEELVKQWSAAIYDQTADDDKRDLFIAVQASRWSADQVLKACCDAIYEHEGRPLCGGTAEWLRAALADHVSDAGSEARPPADGEVGGKELLTLDDLRDAWNAQADAANSWDELGIDEIIWWTQQQAIARWGNATPQPPAAGEVGISAEQQARDMLERMGVPDAQDYAASDLIELANLIAAHALPLPRGEVKQ